MVLAGIWKVFRQMRGGQLRRGRAGGAPEQPRPDEPAPGPGDEVDHQALADVPVGLLFGLGFDTATEVALLVLAGSGAASGLPWYAILCLPVLFAAGMCLLDTIDGSFMNFAYGWAFSKPVRKVYYNLTITGLSVAVALIIGTVELLGLLSRQAGPARRLLGLGRRPRPEHRRLRHRRACSSLTWAGRRGGVEVRPHRGEVDRGAAPGRAAGLSPRRQPGSPPGAGCGPRSRAVRRAASVAAIRSSSAAGTAAVRAASSRSTSGRESASSRAPSGVRREDGGAAVLRVRAAHAPARRLQPVDRLAGGSHGDRHFADDVEHPASRHPVDDLHELELPECSGPVRSAAGRSRRCRAGSRRGRGR